MFYRNKFAITYKLIWSIAEIIRVRNARGKKDIVYGDLFLSRIDTGTQDSSFDISSVVSLIHEQSLNM